MSHTARPSSGNPAPLRHAAEESDDEDFELSEGSVAEDPKTAQLLLETTTSGVADIADLLQTAIGSTLRPHQLTQSSSSRGGLRVHASAEGPLISDAVRSTATDEESHLGDTASTAVIEPLDGLFGSAESLMYHPRSSTVAMVSQLLASPVATQLKASSDVDSTGGVAAHRVGSQTSAVQLASRSTSLRVDEADAIDFGGGEDAPAAAADVLSGPLPKDVTDEGASAGVVSGHGEAATDGSASLGGAEAVAHETPSNEAPKGAVADSEEDAFEAYSSDEDEEAVERQLEAARKDLQFRQQRDEVEESEFEARRHVEDEETLAAQFDGHHELLEALWNIDCEEIQIRSSISEKESLLREDLWEQALVSRGSAGERTIRAAESRSRYDMDQVLFASWMALQQTFRLECLHIALRDDEATQRDTLTALQVDEWIKLLHHSHRDVVALEQNSKARDVLMAEEAACRENLTRLGTAEGCMYQEMPKRMIDEVLDPEVHERHILSDMLQNCLVMHAACQAALAVLCQDEDVARSALAAVEWTERRPMYDAHRQGVMLFKPRKPAVPRAPRKIIMPTPPVKPASLSSSALTPMVRAAASSTLNGSDAATMPPHQLMTMTVKAAVPDHLYRQPHASSPTRNSGLPLKRLVVEPLPNSAVAKQARIHAAQLNATLVDESVGRKSLVARENHQWESLVSNFRHHRRAIDHVESCDEEKSLQRAFRTATGPFRAADRQYERFAVLKEDAKRRRLHHEERFRLQNLVTRLIQVDTAFDDRLAKRAQRHNPTAVAAPRPDFNASPAIAADGAAWAVIPRLQSKPATLPKRPPKPAVSPRPPVAPRKQRKEAHRGRAVELNTRTATDEPRTCDDTVSVLDTTVMSEATLHADSTQNDATELNGTLSDGTTSLEASPVRHEHDGDGLKEDHVAAEEDRHEGAADPVHACDAPSPAKNLSSYCSSSSSSRSSSSSSSRSSNGTPIADVGADNIRDEAPVHAANEAKRDDGAGALPVTPLKDSAEGDDDYNDDSFDESVHSPQSSPPAVKNDAPSPQRIPTPSSSSTSRRSSPSSSGSSDSWHPMLTA